MTTPDPRMRIADSDRERAMADLAQHYADGRLDHEEYDERLDAIWTARTRADLAVLFSDLPRPQAAQPQRTPVRAAGRPGSRRKFPLLPVLAVLIVLSVIADAPSSTTCGGAWEGKSSPARGPVANARSWPRSSRT